MEGPFVPRTYRLRVWEEMTRHPRWHDISHDWGRVFVEGELHNAIEDEDDFDVTKLTASFDTQDGLLLDEIMDDLLSESL